MLKKIGKRGEITTTQIVMIVVLVVSFIVIIYFFSRLNLGSTNNSEVCHNSVVLVSTGKGYVGSLDCSTDYVCISGGGKCSNFNPTTTIKVDATNKDAIMKAIADQMSSCWYQFGEGNLDYKKGITGSVCGLCSVVSFGGKIQKEYPNGISYKDFFNYLNKTVMNNGGTKQTYLTYLYGYYNLENLLSKSSSTVKDFYNSKSIDLSSNFNVITGEGKSLNFNFFHPVNTNYLHPVFLSTSDTSSYVGGFCSQYITKA